MMAIAMNKPLSFRGGDWGGGLQLDAPCTDAPLQTDSPPSQPSPLKGGGL